MIRDSAICIKNTTIALSGSPIDDTYTYLQISVQQCIPNDPGTPTEQQDCFPEGLEGFSLTIGLFSPGVDIENKKNPFNEGLDIENSYSISVENDSEVTMNIKKMEVVTDWGLFF